jgi:hypothetical protein
MIDSPRGSKLQSIRYCAKAWNPHPLNQFNGFSAVRVMHMACYRGPKQSQQWIQIHRNEHFHAGGLHVHIAREN